MGGPGSGRRPNPNRVKPVRRERRLPYDLTLLEAALREGRAAGKMLGEIANEFGVKYATAARHSSRLGLNFPKGLSRHARNDCRAPLMAALFRDGYTLQQIGTQYGLTRERVRQILKKRTGLVGKDGGYRTLAIKKAEARKHRLDAICLAKHGCSHEQYRSLRLGPKSPRRLFSQQRRNAGTRGIGWELNLWQWWTIWQESGHWAERGRGQGYVMCRVNDEGPYAIGNVFIATAIENNSNTKIKKSTLPTGVHKVEVGKYVAYSAVRQLHGKRLYLGHHKTPELAHAAYLAAAPKPKAEAA